jgi:Protein of unknown function (DUF3175)
MPPPFFLPKVGTAIAFALSSRGSTGVPAMATKKQRDTKRWSGGVKTVSTFPPKDTFTKDAKSIARTMASKKVSPKGVGSGIRMIQFFINRAGKNLSPTRRRELEKAIRILQARIHDRD